MPELKDTSKALKRVALKTLCFLSILLIFLLGPLACEGFAEPVKITIAHTNNVSGHLFPCPT